jgi:hypothetical protein
LLNAFIASTTVISLIQVQTFLFGWFGSGG